MVLFYGMMVRITNLYEFTNLCLLKGVLITNKNKTAHLCLLKMRTKFMRTGYKGLAANSLIYTNLCAERWHK